MKKLLVVQVAALGYDFTRQNQLTQIDEMELLPLESVFPALTCTAQATLRTASAPGQHGMITNGYYDALLERPAFWEQSARLVTGQRIWQDFRAAGGRVGMTFFQQSLGEDTDWLLSPAPIHTHGGGMIMDCYSKPADLYQRLQRKVGRKFKLWQYWGPLASVKSSAWIADAMVAALAEADAPELLFTYLPGLDYDLQRHGPQHPRSGAALEEVAGQLRRLSRAARKHGYEVVITGDYAITAVTQPPVFPNRLLREAGLFKTRQVRNMLYPDFYRSRAFAMVDHQVAVLHCRDQAATESCLQLFQEVPGVDLLLDREERKRLDIDHPQAGEITLLAQEGSWFAYHWWQHHSQAPDYATHVDIHNKPGFDACELFFGKTPFQSSLDTTRVKGAHGRGGPRQRIAWSSTIDLQATTPVELAQAVKGWLTC